jgi:hypothetical protein
LTVLASTGLIEVCQDTLSGLVDRAVVSLIPSVPTVAVAVPILVTPVVVLCLAMVQGRCDEALAGWTCTASVVAAVITRAAAAMRRGAGSKILPF